VGKLSMGTNGIIFILWVGLGLIESWVTEFFFFWRGRGVEWVEPIASY
jgi:hypothetical protein